MRYSIVLVTSIVVASTAAAVSSKFDTYSRIGGIIGTSVSAAFLIILSLLNVWIGYKLLQQLRKLLRCRDGEEEDLKIEGGGCLFVLFKKMFRLIDRYVPLVYLYY